jgi:hypothetical protein
MAALLGIFIRRFRQVRRIGLVAAFRLVWARMSRWLADGARKQVARLCPTGLKTWKQESLPQNLLPVLVLPQDGAETNWCEHIFDLLGSGPQRTSLQLAHPLADLPRAWRRRYRLLRSMLPGDYQLIDWQRDAKSGHRWSARQWHHSIRYGHIAGVDVKWPWELARMQHLPPMAGRLQSAPSESRIRLEKELRAQIIDFVMQNPPGFGVNWVCAMDVGIRAANIAVAVDLAHAAGTRYDDGFLTLVSTSLRDHGRFLTQNLEWGSLCSNHYLADVVGLLYCAAYLPVDRETSNWLAFAGREIVQQLRQQFHPDGTNFEASTCYHRLSGEMMLYGVAMMLHLAARRPGEVVGWWAGHTPSYHPPPEAPPLPDGANSAGTRVLFNPDNSNRLAGIGAFTATLLRRDGSVPLIGDDDSGRFMRLGYSADAYADLVSHEHLPAAIAALFANSGIGVITTAESNWIKEWVGPSALAIPAQPLEPAGRRFVRHLDFGLYVWNKSRFRLTLRCGSVGQNGNGGHAHSDQLAVTLDLDGQAVAIDPGTAVYTPDPETRNRFRSARAHSGIVVPRVEPNEWLPGGAGLFSMRDCSHASILFATESGAKAAHVGYGVVVEREIVLYDHVIVFEDGMNALPTTAFCQLVLHPAVMPEIGNGSQCALKINGRMALIAQASAGVLWTEDTLFSPGYGRLAQTKALCWRGGRLRLEIPG